MLNDPSLSWLVDKLGLWTSPGVEDGAHFPTDVPLILPPPGLTPDSHLLPRLIWGDAPPNQADQQPQPMKDAFLESYESAPANAPASTSLQSAFMVGSGSSFTVLLLPAYLGSCCRVYSVDYIQCVLARSSRWGPNISDRDKRSAGCRRLPSCDDLAALADNRSPYSSHKRLSLIYSD